MFKTFYSTSTDGMICFYSNIGCSESKVIFKWRKNNNNNSNRKKKPLQGASVRTSCITFSLSQNSLTERDKQTRDAQKLAQNVFPPWKPTLTSRSLQSITRQFQKRFREIFGNARILIFYLSIKAWEEKSLPKSHLGCFFLVFGEGTATKENMSIFWFIWPLSPETIQQSWRESRATEVPLRLNFAVHFFCSLDVKNIVNSKRGWTNWGDGVHNCRKF